MYLQNCINRVSKRILNNSINDNQLTTIINNKSKLFSLTKNEFALLLEREVERQCPQLYLFKILGLFMQNDYTTQFCNDFFEKSCTITEIKIGGLFDIWIIGYYNEDTNFNLNIKFINNENKYNIFQHFNLFTNTINNFLNYQALFINGLTIINFHIPISHHITTCNNIYYMHIDISTLEYTSDDLLLINNLYNSHNTYFKQF